MSIMSIVDRITGRAARNAKAQAAADRDAALAQAVETCRETLAAYRAERDRIVGDEDDLGGAFDAADRAFETIAALRELQARFRHDSRLRVHYPVLLHSDERDRDLFSWSLERDLYNWELKLTAAYAAQDRLLIQP